jgi:hypothetical protein
MSVKMLGSLLKFLRMVQEYLVLSALVCVLVTTQCWSGQRPINDGSANAPAGIPELPNLLSGYNVRPAWSVAGVDYYVGTPSGTVLKSPTTISMAGVSVNAATHTVTVSGSNVTLNGYDFSPNGGWGIDVVNGATNVTIQNSYFKVGTNNLIPVDAYYGGAVNLLYNTFDGGGSSGSTVNNMFKSGAGATIEYNRFTNVPDDAINVVNNGNFVIQYNLFDYLGFGDYHTDAIQSFFSPVASMIVQYNTMYQPASGGGMNAFIRIGDQGTYVVSNPVMAYNTLVFQNTGGSANVFQIGGGTAPATLTNPTIHDNFIDPTSVQYAIVPTFYLTPPNTVNPTTYDNFNLTNGQHILFGPYNSQTAGIPANPPAPPVITGETAVNTNQFNLTGTGPAGTTIDVYDQGVLLGSTQANSSGAWSFTTGQLTGGAHAFTARATDSYTNTSAASQIFDVNLGPPTPKAVGHSWTLTPFD